MPNDGVKGKYLIEVKSTVFGSMSVKRRWLEELTENAMLRGKVPTLIVVFNSDDIRDRAISNAWVAVPLDNFEKLSLGWRTR